MFGNLIRKLNMMMGKLLCFFVFGFGFGWVVFEGAGLTWRGASKCFTACNEQEETQELQMPWHGWSMNRT